MNATAQHERPARVAIAGGGVAALEAALALDELAGERVESLICSPRREFVYRPFAVGEPFGAASLVHYDLARLARACGAGFHLGGIAAVDEEAGVAVSRDGERLPFDFLIAAQGARMLWAVPGAVTFWGVADEGGVGAIVHRLRSGALRNVAFTVPGGCSWALPIYELALLAGAVLARSGIADARLTVVTPEDAPLELFGRAVGEQMTELLAERGIEVVAGASPVEFTEGQLRVAPGEPVETEAVISLPRLEGRRIEGVPHDAEGFVVIDEHCRALGSERLYAAGDVTSFPVKQGGIATQEADAAAAAIAAAIGCAPEAEPFDPVLRGVLWTGAEPRYLYGRPSGGHGEVSTLTETSPWPENEGKVVGRLLTPFLESMPDRLPGATAASAAVSSR